MSNGVHGGGSAGAVCSVLSCTPPSRNSAFSDSSSRAAGAQRLTKRDPVAFLIAVHRRSPRVEFGREEVAVPVMRDRSGGAVLEFEVGRIEAGDLALRHPLAGGPAHAAQQAAAEQPHRVDLMRALTVNDAAALFEDELVGRSRAQHPIGVRPHEDRAYAADVAAQRQPPHCAHAQPEARRVTGQQFYAVSFRGFAHPIGFVRDRRPSASRRRRASPNASLRSCVRSESDWASQPIRPRCPPFRTSPLTLSNVLVPGNRASNPSRTRAFTSAPAMRSISGMAIIEGMTPPAPWPRPATPMRSARLKP